MTDPIAPPGPERDAQVAVEVFGWRQAESPCRLDGQCWLKPGKKDLPREHLERPQMWSTDDRECLAVLTEMQRRDWFWDVSYAEDGIEVSLYRFVPVVLYPNPVTADTMAAAVTEAALCAVRAQGCEDTV